MLKSSAGDGDVADNFDHIWKVWNELQTQRI